MAEIKNTTKPSKTNRQAGQESLRQGKSNKPCSRGLENSLQSLWPMKSNGNTEWQG